MGRLAIRAGSLLVFATLFLTGPALSGGAAWRACVRWTPLWAPLGFHLNCDSPLFIGLATNPRGLLAFPGSVRQDRPAYVLLGAAVALPIRKTLPGLDWPLPRDQAASWWAYVLLNFAILLAAVGLFDRLVEGAGRLTVAAFVFGSWLLVNDVVKQFLWTPHTQLFNVLVPVVVVAAANDALCRARMTTTRAVGAGLVFGFGALAYGSFAIPCVAFVASLWLRRRLRAERVALTTLVKHSLCTLGAFALPSAAWLVYLRLRTGGYYNHEVASYREFVWMLDAWQHGAASFAAALGENLLFFAPTTASVLWLPCAALAVLVVLARASGVSLRGLGAERRTLLVSTAVAFGITLVFLALLGFYAQRLSWALVPPLLVDCVVVGEALDARLKSPWREVARLALVATLVAGLAVEVRSTLPPLSPGSPAEARSWAAAKARVKPASAAPAPPAPR